MIAEAQIRERMCECLLDLADALGPKPATDAASAAMAGLCQAMFEIAAEHSSEHTARSLIKASLLAGSPLVSELFASVH